MIKLNASYSKKVPAREKYSSQSYLACVEVELPTGADQQELQAKIHETFDLVRRSVEDEIAQAASGSGRGEKSPQRGSEQPVKASNKQIKYILDLGKAREKALQDLNHEASSLFGVETIYDLSKKDASRFVDVLKEAA